MIFMSQHLKIVLIILMIFFMGACQDSPERHLELGNWYLQKDLVDEAIIEFREVDRMFPADHSKLTREEYQILGTAHFKLALAYTKKGWWEYALEEAKNSFELQPSKDTHELVELIQEKLSLNQDS